MQRTLGRSLFAPTPPVVQSHSSGIFELLWHQDTPHAAQGVRRGMPSSPGRSFQLPSLPITPADSNPSDNECIVCRSGGEEDNDAGLTLKIPTEACTHPPQVCIGCLQQVILAAVTNGDYITGIRCPSYDCAQRMGYYDVQKWAAKEVFDRYDKLLLRKSLRTEGRFVFCVEPSCTAGQEHISGDDNNIVTCYHCGTKQCFRHQIPWHDGLTCEQWDEQKRILTESEQMTEDWIRVETKACPGAGCGKRIQKSDGCNHMTCKPPGGCSFQFCWECLAPWAQIISGDNSRHYDSCKYYTGLPGKNPAPTSRGPIPGPSTNQRPPAPTPSPFVMLEHTADMFLGEDRATQTRRKNAEAQKLYRERKKQYEAGLLSKVQSQQGRINELEAQIESLRAERSNKNQLPLYSQNQTYISPITQTGRYHQYDPHDFSSLDARFMQPAPAVSTLFQDSRPILPFNQ